MKRLFLLFLIMMHMSCFYPDPEIIPVSVYKLEPIFMSILQIGNQWKYEVLVEHDDVSDPERYFVWYKIFEIVLSDDTIVAKTNYHQLDTNELLFDSSTILIKVFNNKLFTSTNKLRHMLPIDCPMMNGIAFDSIYSTRTEYLGISHCQIDTLYKHVRNGSWKIYHANEKIIFNSSIGKVFNEVGRVFDYHFPEPWIYDRSILREFNGDKNPFGLHYLRSEGYTDYFKDDYNVD